MIYSKNDINTFQTNKKNRNVKGYNKRDKVIIREKCLSVLMLSPLYFRRSLPVRLEGLKTMVLDFFTY